MARAVAERLVALALNSTRPDAAWLVEAIPALRGAGGRLEAVALAGPEFERAVGGGADVAYVMPVERSAGTDPCAMVRAAARGAPWLNAGAAEGGGTGALIPLIETRRTLLLRRGIGGVEVDGHGTPLLHGAWRETGPATP